MQRPPPNAILASQEAIDYGEPKRNQISDIQRDAGYYELLKSLGYVH